MINVQVKGLDQLIPKIRSLPPELQEQVVAEVGEYSLEVMRGEQPEYNYVSREAAYGTPFFSDAQRGWFFAALARGEIEIPYRRTGALAGGWNIQREKERFILNNAVPHAPYVQGIAAQSRHERMVGWKNAYEVIEASLTFRNSRFRDAVHEAYRKALHNVRIE